MITFETLKSYKIFRRINPIRRSECAQTRYLSVFAGGGKQTHGVTNALCVAPPTRHSSATPRSLTGANYSKLYLLLSMAYPYHLRGRPPFVVIPHPTDTPGQTSFVIPLRVSLPQQSARSRSDLQYFSAPAVKARPTRRHSAQNPPRPLLSSACRPLGGLGLTAVAREAF